MKNNGNPFVQLSWFGTNQKRCGHKAQSDWLVSVETFVLNLVNTVNGWGQCQMRKIETTGLWNSGSWKKNLEKYRP